MHFAENSLMPSGLEVHDYGEIKRPKTGQDMFCSTALAWLQKWLSQAVAYNAE